MQKYLGCAVVLVGCGQLPLPVSEPAPMPTSEPVAVAVAPAPPKRAPKPVPGEWSAESGGVEPMPVSKEMEAYRKQHEDAAAAGKVRAEADAKARDAACEASYLERASRYNAQLLGFNQYFKRVSGKEKQIEAACTVRNDLHSVLDHVGGHAVVRDPRRDELVLCTRPLPAGVTRDDAYVWLAGRDQTLIFDTPRENEDCEGPDARNGHPALGSIGR